MDINIVALKRNGTTVTDSAPTKEEADKKVKKWMKDSWYSDGRNNGEIFMVYYGNYDNTISDLQPIENFDDEQEKADQLSQPWEHGG